MNIIPRIFLLLCLFCAHLNYAQITPKTVEIQVSKNSVEKSIDNIMTKSGMESAAVSCYVVELGSGKVVADYNGAMSLTPASVMKVVTTSAAMEVLGPWYKFETTLRYTGTIDTNGVLHGDLFIKGEGDPTLGSRFFNKDGEERNFLKTWVDSIKTFGIKSIEGRVIADASAFGQEMIPSGWSWGDLGNYYGAGPSGLTVYDNMTYLQFYSGPAEGDSTWIDCIEPYVPEYTVDNFVTAANIKSDNAYVFGGPYQSERYVEGQIPMDQEEFGVKASIHDPPLVLATDLSYELEQNGIPVKYSSTTVRRLKWRAEEMKALKFEPIYVHESPSLFSIMSWVNQRSVNLFAEHILRAVGMKYYGTGTTYNGAVAVESFWRKRIDTRGMSVEDGSGLSRKNSLSAKNLVDVLVRMNGSSNAERFKETLAVAGKSGTLYSVGRGTSAQGRVFGKSGSMTRVRSYTGYVNSKSGKKLAFAVITNNFTCKNYMTKKYLAQLFIAMSNY